MNLKGPQLKSTTKHRVQILKRDFYIYGFKADGYFQSIENGADVDILCLASCLLQEDSNSIDVGGNIGYESIYFSKCQPSGKVFTFEPVKQNVDLIQRSIRKNKVDNISVYQLGLGDKKQSGKISFNNGNRGGAFIKDVANTKKYDNTFSLSITTLDSLDLEIDRLDLIKVDIEGFEPNFLRGAKKTIQKYKPSMIIEANHWTLDAFNHTSMSGFLDQILDIYPYAAAFHEDQWLNIRTDRMDFLYQNLVFRKFQNIYLDFNKKRFSEAMKKQIATYNAR